MSSFTPEMQKLISELTEARQNWAAATTTGKRVDFTREDGSVMHTILHTPSRLPATPMPVLVNMHGGAWIGGDAILMESFCALMAEKLQMTVVNLNYTKADVRPLPYAQEECRDIVLLLAQKAVEYHIDPAKIVVGGHSAGAHIAIGAAMLLRDARFALAGQMLVYPATDLSPDREDTGKELSGFLPVMFADGGEDAPWASPARTLDGQLMSLAPALMIVCGKDSLRSQGLVFADRLIQNGVTVTVREYPTALHGFLEVNRPDYPADERQTPEQATLARDAEQWLLEMLPTLWA